MNINVLTLVHIMHAYSNIGAYELTVSLDYCCLFQVSHTGIQGALPPIVVPRQQLCSQHTVFVRQGRR